MAKSPSKKKKAKKVGNNSHRRSTHNNEQTNTNQQAYNCANHFAKLVKEANYREEDFDGLTEHGTMTGDRSLIALFYQHYSSIVKLAEDKSIDTKFLTIPITIKACFHDKAKILRANHIARDALIKFGIAATKVRNLEQQQDPDPVDWELERCNKANELFELSTQQLKASKHQLEITDANALPHITTATRTTLATRTTMATRTTAQTVTHMAAMTRTRMEATKNMVTMRAAVESAPGWFGLGEHKSFLIMVASYLKLLLCSSLLLCCLYQRNKRLNKSQVQRLIHSFVSAWGQRGKQLSNSYLET